MKSMCFPVETMQFFGQDFVKAFSGPAVYFLFRGMYFHYQTNCMWFTCFKRMGNGTQSGTACQTVTARASLRYVQGRHWPQWFGTHAATLCLWVSRQLGLPSRNIRRASTARSNSGLRPAVHLADQSSVRLFVPYAVQPAAQIGKLQLFSSVDSP